MGRPPRELPGSADHRADVLPLEEIVRRAEAGPGQTDERTGLEKENTTCGGAAFSGEADFEGCRGGKLLSPERRLCAVEHARRKYGVRERTPVGYGSSGAGRSDTSRRIA